MCRAHASAAGWLISVPCRLTPCCRAPSPRRGCCATSPRAPSTITRTASTLRWVGGCSARSSVPCKRQQLRPVWGYHPCPHLTSSTRLPPLPSSPPLSPSLPSPPFAAGLPLAAGRTPQPPDRRAGGGPQARAVTRVQGIRCAGTAAALHLRSSVLCGSRVRFGAHYGPPGPHQHLPGPCSLTPRPQVRRNAAALGTALTKRGYKLVTGGTGEGLQQAWVCGRQCRSYLGTAIERGQDAMPQAGYYTASRLLSLKDPGLAPTALPFWPADNHLVLWDLRPEGITGSKMEKACDLCHITLNKNAGACGWLQALGHCCAPQWAGIALQCASTFPPCMVPSWNCVQLSLVRACSHRQPKPLPLRSGGRCVGTDPRRRAHRFPCHDLSRPQGVGCVCAGCAAHGCSQHRRLQWGEGGCRAIRDAPKGSPQPASCLVAAPQPASSLFCLPPHHSFTPQYLHQLQTLPASPTSCTRCWRSARRCSGAVARSWPTSPGALSHGVACRDYLTLGAVKAGAVRLPLCAIKSQRCCCCLLSAVSMAAEQRGDCHPCPAAAVQCN